MASETSVTGLPTGITTGVTGNCVGCSKGKMSRGSHPPTSEKRSNGILDLIHTDVCAPMSEKFGGGAR